MSRLYFIRHGQASFGHSTYDQLSERGYRQGRRLAEHLADRGVSFDVIYTGTLTRHIQTADCLLTHINEAGRQQPEVIRLSELDEYDSQQVLQRLIPELMRSQPELSADVQQMLSDSRAFMRIFEAVMQSWVAGDYTIADLVDWKSYINVVNRGLDRIMKNHGRKKSVGVFTSGGPIAVTMKRALDLNDEQTIRLTWQIVNASYTVFKCTHERIALSSFNENAYLCMGPHEGLITYR